MYSLATIHFVVDRQTDRQQYHANSRSYWVQQYGCLIETKLRIKPESASSKVRKTEGWLVLGAKQCRLVHNTLCLKKETPMLSIVTLKRINGFQRFLAQIFPTQLAIKWRFNFPPHPTASTLLFKKN